MLELAGLAVLGLVVGAYGTIIGAGGGFILVPVLLILYPDYQPEQLTAFLLGYRLRPPHSAGYNFGTPHPSPPGLGLNDPSLHQTGAVHLVPKEVLPRSSVSNSCVLPCAAPHVRRVICFWRSLTRPFTSVPKGIGIIGGWRTGWAPRQIRGERHGRFSPPTCLFTGWLRFHARTAAEPYRAPGRLVVVSHLADILYVSVHA